MFRRHRVVVVVAALGGAAAIAACGGTASDSNISGSSSPSSNNNTAFFKFSECMRANGVTNFPDPNGHGIQLSKSSGVNPFSPAFKAAQSKCRHVLPGGGPTSGRPSAAAKLAALRISECMRRHGISDFPDPTTTLPSNPNGYTEIADRGGVVLAIPNTINTGSPAYQQAASACGFH
jgi:hypothetical protein